MSTAPMVPYTEKIKQALFSFRDGLQTRMDSWVNPVTGYGTARDKSEFGFILPSRTLNDIELSALYHSDDMAARMVDVVPQEMLREGFGVATGVPELDLLINTKLDELDAPGKLADGIRWGRAFGGAGVLIGADDGREASFPLVPERAQDISYLYVIDRRLLWPLSWYDEVGHPKLGQPRTYLVTTAGGTDFSTNVVHESRLIIFRGSHTGIRERMQLMGWDFSVMQRIYEVLRSFNTGWKSVETLLTDGNQAIFKMTGLAESLSSGSEAVLRARMQAMDLYRSVMRAMVIDADGKEEFARQSTSFAGIPDTLDKFMLRLAAAVQIPVTILMGQSPSGMNATGESDFRWFYDRIRAEQTTMLAPKIRRIVDIYLKTKTGRSLKGQKQVKQIDVKFPALWTETPLVAAQRRYAIAQGDALYITSQAIQPDEVALQRFRPDGFQNELILTPESIKAREAALAYDLEKLAAGGVDDEAAEDETDIAADTETPAADVQATASALKLDAGPRPFVLQRDEDETGVSGTGEIAEGCVFADGKVAVRWKTATAATTLFDSIADMLKVHGHGGKTRIIYDDERSK